MTACDAWIGARVDATFRLTPGEHRDDILARHGPAFPTGHRAFTLVLNGIRDLRYRGCAIAPLIHACTLPKRELGDLVDQCSAHDSLEHLVERWREVRAYVDALPDGHYVVIVSEL
ncbi:MAG TPA: hypothetical protein VLX92_20555 [Kofleriaceae bacterium]|nr:hypothetical protein [Kofleriaceae bacterium]